jgi:uncharacterized protein with HEPN domain
MSRDWQTYLADIVTACEKVTRFTTGMEREACCADDRTYHAVVHCLLIVGGAAKHIPDDVRKRMPEIERRKIAGMRDWLAHAYFAINDDMLWSVVETGVPEPSRALEAFKHQNQP